MTKKLNGWAFDGDKYHWYVDGERIMTAPPDVIEALWNKMNKGKLSELLKWLEGKKYVNPKCDYELGRNRMIDKTIEKINEMM